MQPLVLLPGLLLDAAVWAHQAEHLTDVAAVTVGDLSQVDSMAELAAQVLAAAPERFALAGLSMGGYTALEIMRQAPERVTKLALLDTSARADSAEQLRRRRGLVTLSRQGRFKGVTPRLLPLYIHRDRLEDAALIDTITRQAERLGPEVFARQQTAIMGRPDSRPDLPAITCPTLVLCGREDQATPLEVSAEIAGLVPNARLAIVEECGHLAPIERPQAVTALLRDWLIYDR